MTFSLFRMLFNESGTKWRWLSTIKTHLRTMKVRIVWSWRRTSIVWTSGRSFMCFWWPPWPLSKWSPFVVYSRLSLPMGNSCVERNSRGINGGFYNYFAISLFFLLLRVSLSWFTFLCRCYRLREKNKNIRTTVKLRWLIHTPFFSGSRESIDHPLCFSCSLVISLALFHLPEITR